MHYTGFSKPTVSNAIRQLREQKLVEMEAVGNLIFTHDGKKRVDVLGQRICFFQQHLTAAGLNPKTALQDAVSFSWEMSDSSFAAFQFLLGPVPGIVREK